jgi:hypothetical protein
MLGSVFFKYRPLMSRPARLTILWTSLFLELLLIGIFLAYSGVEAPSSSAALTAFYAVAICIPIGPLLTVAFKVKDSDIETHSAGTAVTLCEMVLYFICLLIFVGSTAVTAFLLTEAGEMMVHYWVIYYVFAVMIEFLGV